MPAVSIIVPVYNAENYLERCVNSLISQTLSDIEIILVDDGSSDRSSQICDEYEKKDQRVKTIHQKNSGVSVARNKGLEVASGEYITFVDSDDYIEPQMYQSMMEIAIKYECDFVMCDCLKEYSEKSVPYTHSIRSGYYNKEQLRAEYYPHLLMMENIEYPPTISNWVCVFKRELVNGMNPVRYVEGVRFSEDLLFGAQLMQQANSFYYMKNVYFYHYCMNSDSVTHVFSLDKWKDYLRLYQEAKNTLGKSEEYDFENQIDLMLLFFVYNVIGDILKESKLNKKEKSEKTKEILKTTVVQDMFHRVKIFKLPIPFKLKIQTYIYKYQLVDVYQIVLQLKEIWGKNENKN